MFECMLWNLAAVCTGYLLDLIVGDPNGFPHMVRGVGLLVRGGERLLRPLCGDRPGALLVGGGVLAAMVTLSSLGLSVALIWGAWRVNLWLGFLVASLLAHQTLATKNLSQEGRAVAEKLEEDDLPGARARLGRIVGRDTAELNEAAIVKATVETLSENLSDGVVAPLLYGLFLGVPAAVFYKAVNTLDSMVGYKSDKYLYFGRASARLDDLMNLIPSRLSALLIVLICPIIGLSSGAAYIIWRRDCRKHPSPNSGQPEAAAAGALGIQLGGGSSYGGRWVDKPTLGDDLDPPEAAHIRVADTLLWGCSLAMTCLGGTVVVILSEVVKRL